MTTTLENNTPALELSEIRYLTITELVDLFDTGRIGHFRKKYYIRSQITEKSVEEKKTALITFDPAFNKHYVEVKEAFIFETNPDGTWNVVSGNTRSVALQSLFTDGKHGDIEITEDNFKLIPYRVYNGLLSVHDLIDYQVSTNDSTERHSPIDLAIKIAELKPLYETELVEEYKTKNGKAPSPKEQKNIAGLVTQRLCSDFKKTKAALTQYLNVANKGTDKLQQFVNEGKASLDTANTIVQKLGGDKAKPEAIDKALEDLWGQAKLAVGKEDATIFKSQVLDYFKNLEDAKNPPEQEQKQKEPGEGQGLQKSGEQPPITEEIFIKNVSDALDISYALNSSAFQEKQGDKVRKLISTSSEAILSVLDVLPEETAANLYDTFIEVWRQTFKNPEALATAIKANEKVDLTAVNKPVAKLSGVIEKLHKELTTPAKAPKTEKSSVTQEPVQPVAVTEVIELPEEEKTEPQDETEVVEIETDEVIAEGIW